MDFGALGGEGEGRLAFDEDTMTTVLCSHGETCAVLQHTAEGYSLSASLSTSWESR